MSANDEGNGHPAEKGFTLVGVLVITLIIGIISAGVAPFYSTMVRGEKERELLYRLNCFRRGLKRYYAKYKKNPSHLEELTKEKMLRQIYPDPMTGKADWKLVLGKGFGIMDIHSVSVKEALKKGEKDEKNTYDKW